MCSSTWRRKGSRFDSWYSRPMLSYSAATWSKSAITDRPYLLAAPDGGGCQQPGAKNRITDCYTVAQRPPPASLLRQRGLCAGFDSSELISTSSAPPIHRSPMPNRSTHAVPYGSKEDPAYRRVQRHTGTGFDSRSLSTSCRRSRAGRFQPTRLSTAVVMSANTSSTGCSPSMSSSIPRRS